MHIEYYVLYSQQQYRVHKVETHIWKKKRFSTRYTQRNKNIRLNGIKTALTFTGNM